MGLIDLIPAPYRLLAGIAAALMLVGCIYAVGRHDGASAVRAEWNIEKAEQARDAMRDAIAKRDKERAWSEKYQGAVNDRTKLENQLAAARAAASASDDRLRRAAGDFQRRLAQASIEACRTAASTAATLLGECSAAYRDVAAAADGHAADVQQCEAAWPE